MIFVNGLQRSGTNFAKSLYNNAKDYCHPYWKHNLKYESIDPDCEKVYCIIKNPYTWVESICFRDEADIVASFQFLCQLRDENDYLGPFKINLQKLCTVYKTFYTTWLAYDKTELIHYESLLIDNNIHKIVPQGHNWDPKRYRTYLRYEAPLVPQEAKNIITETLGQDFFKKIGYEPKL